MPNPPIQFPSTFTAANAVAFANPDNSAQTVSLDAPLPVAVTNLPGSQTVSVANFPTTQAISAASLPLPTGAATATAQASAITTLSAISGQLPASLGAKTGAASLSIAPATDLANIEPAGAAVTGTTMPTGGTGLTGWLSAIYRSCSEGAAVTGTATSAAVVVSASNSLYMGGSFQVTSAGTSCTVSYEQSNDGTNWVALPVISSAAANSAPVTSSTIAGLFSFSSTAAFVRARVSTYGSGTVSITLSQKQQSSSFSGVSLAGGSSALGSVTVTGTVNSTTGFTDSQTALAASATFTGTGRNTNSLQYCFFNACAYADQAGTLFIDQSTDTGTTYQPILSQAVTAGGSANLSVRLCGSLGTGVLYRVRYVNGATAQTVFRLSSSYTAS
ncbi:hypothetical protein [Novosphingobium olei]|uniref:Uncharacterized protein n=1 Tax=Novosphingobium olei TaxID=2728851 RepID=A0A7Y0BP44_9SPHN|nr:hypothetical protein [Novosphingobium olei]NML93316.1 hypothetical protein [Novosphingobium olei]